MKDKQKKKKKCFYQTEGDKHVADLIAVKRQGDKVPPISIFGLKIKWKEIEPFCQAL